MGFDTRRVNVLAAALLVLLLWTWTSASATATAPRVATPAPPGTALDELSRRPSELAEMREPAPAALSPPRSPDHDDPRDADASGGLGPLVIRGTMPQHPAS